MGWTERPQGPGWYFVVFRGEVAVGRFDGDMRSATSVDLVGSDAGFGVWDFSFWCRIPDPPPFLPENHRLS